MESVKDYLVSGIIVDRNDSVRHFKIQVKAASIRLAVNMAKSCIRIRRGDLVRDISVKEIR